MNYAGVHLCFTSHVSPELMSLLFKCKKLLDRILTLKEVNLDFYFYNDSVFHFGRKNLLPIFKLLADPDEAYAKGKISAQDALEQLAEEMANRLFTVCAVYTEFPYIQY